MTRAQLRTSHTRLGSDPTSHPQSCLKSDYAASQHRRGKVGKRTAGRNELLLRNICRRVKRGAPANSVIMCNLCPSVINGVQEEGGRRAGRRGGGFAQPTVHSSVKRWRSAPINTWRTSSIFRLRVSFRVRRSDRLSDGLSA